MQNTILQNSVRQAILTIRERYEEPLSLDGLAKTAMMSKFHFVRTFRAVTGVTPIRFLSAVRIDEAKRLLCTTSLTVAETSVQVGYGSLATFSRRFTECVGLPPTTYRQMSRGLTVEQPLAAARGDHPHPGTLTGTARAPWDVTSPLFVGVFKGRFLRGRPAASTTLSRPGPWRLPAVPAGRWHLLVAAATCDLPGGRDVADRTLLAVTTNGVRVRPGKPVHVDVTLRPLDWTSPPLMVALPGVEAPHGA